MIRVARVGQCCLGFRLRQFVPGVDDDLAVALQRQLAREEAGLADRVGDRDFHLVLAGG
jgi:hypothetical protein